MEEASDQIKQMARIMAFGSYLGFLESRESSSESAEKNKHKNILRARRAASHSWKAYIALVNDYIENGDIFQKHLD